MSWELLRTDYVDAVFEGLRRYLVSENGDGSVSFHDITNYTVREGAFFGAKDANAINTAVNAILAALENGTDLYEVFTQFFEAQKALFLAESDAKQDGFEAYIVNLRQYMDGKWDELKAEYTGDIQYFKDVQENAFNVWFQMVRDQLTNDVAGHLQTQIGNLELLETEEKGNLVSAINSILLSYDDAMAILCGVKTLTVTLSASDGAGVEGQKVTLHNIASGEDMVKEYSREGITFAVFGDMEYSLRASGMENYVAPGPVKVLIDEGEGLEVQLEYKPWSFNNHSWAQIAEISESGRASEIFSLHDEKEVVLTTGEKIILEIADFNHDILASDEEKTAGITLIMKDSLKDKFTMNPDQTNVGGWEYTKMRNRHIRENFYDVLPADLKAEVKTVIKNSASVTDYTKAATTKDDIWLLSAVEMEDRFNGFYGREGSTYPIFTDKASRIKKQGTNGEPVTYFLRSIDKDSHTNFFIVNTYGVVTNGSGSANTAYGMVIGLCV